MEIPSIVGVPGYRSNEPGQLERADVDFEVFDPADFDVPGSFGVIFSSAEFVNEHPTAAQDFMRASMRGLADAIDDPDAATAIAVELINGNDNPNFLSPEGEEFRWRVESELVAGTAELPAGVIDPDLLQAEVDAYAAVGMFGEETPDLEGTYVDVLTEVYADDGTVIWPSG
jgi:NitT/TauT family transport system substrate-binding protein